MLQSALSNKMFCITIIFCQKKYNTLIHNALHFFFLECRKFIQAKKKSVILKLRYHTITRRVTLDSISLDPKQLCIV